MRLASVFLVLCLGCSATSTPQTDKRTLPDPLVAANLPERPDSKPIPPTADWAAGVSGYYTQKDGEEPRMVDRPGVCMSLEKAGRSARYVIGYNELRGLYEVDIRTWDRERTIYDRHLGDADKEVERQAKLAERSWFERHGFDVGLGVGVVVGVVAATAAAAALNKVTN